MEGFPFRCRKEALAGLPVRCNQCNLLVVPGNAYRKAAGHRTTVMPSPTPGEPPVRMGLLGIVGPCTYCGAQGRMTRDHVVPCARSGNFYVYCCAGCNLSKGNRTLREWLGCLAPEAPQQYLVPLLVSYFPQLDEEPE